MKFIKVQTPKKNNLAALGRANPSPPPSPLLKSLSLERNLRKLEKRLSSQQRGERRHEREHEHSVEEQIGRLELEWREIRRELSANSRSKQFSSKKNEEVEIPHAKIDLGASSSRLVMSAVFRAITPQNYPQTPQQQSNKKQIKGLQPIKMIPIKRPTHKPQPHAPQTPNPSTHSRLKKSTVAATNGIACINLTTNQNPHKKPGLTMLSPKRLLQIKH